MLKIVVKEKFRTSRSSSYPHFENLEHETLYFSSEESYKAWKKQLGVDVPEQNKPPFKVGFHIEKSEFSVDSGGASVLSELLGFRTGVY